MQPALSHAVVLDQALATVGECPLIRRYLFGDRAGQRIKDALDRSWPQQSPELISWLALAGSGREQARQVVQHLENTLQRLETTPDAGAWRSRVKKLASGGARKFDDRYNQNGTFYSTLFEINLWSRLSHPSYQIRFASDTHGGADLTAASHGGTDILSIEAFAPRRTLKDDLRWQDEVQADLLAGGTGLIPHSRFLALSPQALPDALRNLINAPEFERKRRQLDRGAIPTVLAIWPWSLTPDGQPTLLLHLTGFGDDASLPSALTGLPERCLGVLLCYFDLSLATANGIEFVPAPGLSRNGDVEEFFDSVGVTGVQALHCRMEAQAPGGSDA